MRRGTALLSLAAMAATPAVVRAQSVANVRVIATPLDAAGPVFYAKDLGLFDKVGLNVDIIRPTDNGITVSAIASGATEIGYVNITQIELAFHRGVPIRILVPSSITDTTSGRQTDYLLVPKLSPVKTSKDFEGKTLGTSPLKSLGDFAFNAWADQRGADSSKFKWVEIPFVNLSAAMDAGRIDGAFTVEPFATQSLETARTFCHPFSAIAKRFVGAAFCVNPAWADANKDVAKRFVSAIHDAAAWGNLNHEKSGAILQKYSKVDSATIAAMARSKYPDSLDPDDFQSTIDFLVKAKVIDTGFRAEDMFYKLN
jgi:NitT/TauT family transport system substrate-binding protein